MKDKRRDFIKKGAALAAASFIGGLQPAIAAANRPVRKQNQGSSTNDLAKDGGLQMSEAYFAGMQEQKIALTKQMGVLGAVSGINTHMVGMPDAKPFDPKAITAVKEAWTNVGLNFNVIEDPLSQRKDQAGPGRPGRGGRQFHHLHEEPETAWGY